MLTGLGANAKNGRFKNYTMEQAIEWMTLIAWLDLAVVGRIIGVVTMAKVIDSENYLMEA